MRRAATVWLVGMMGAGKSAVGRALAAKLGVPFRDSDADVERAAGTTVSEIFAREGEAGFRARERRAIETLAGVRAVVALGGGAVAQPGTAELLERTGTVVYLRARPETLLERVGSATERPLLDGLDRSARLERLRSLLRQRESSYARAAVVVDTDSLAVDEVAARVAARLEERDG